MYREVPKNLDHLSAHLENTLYNGNQRSIL